MFGVAAHTRARENVHKLEVECKAVQTRHETKQLELKNELDRHSRDRSQLLEDHNQKLDEIHLTNTAVVRCFLVPSVLFGVGLVLLLFGSCCRLLVFGVWCWCLVLFLFFGFCWFV